MGSPTYASPEQMKGKRVGPPSDIFSLGVLAWEFLLIIFKILMNFLRCTKNPEKLLICRD